MKKVIITILMAVFAFNYSNSTSTLKKVNPEDRSCSSADSIGLKKQTFKKLSVKEFLVLKILQRKIKKHLRKNGSLDTFILYNKDKKPFKWHWGGFFLGLLLPFGVGLIISALKKNERKSDRVTSAAIGTVIISLVIIILVLNSFSHSIL